MSSSLEHLLVLQTSHPTVFSIIGSHYFHSDGGHLLSNLVLYYVLMIFVFSFDSLTNKRMLLVNLLLFFVVLPVFSSLVNIVAFTAMGVDATGYGFSAVVACVFGYLAFSFLHFLREQYKITFTQHITVILWFFLFVNLLWICLIYGYLYVALLLVVLLVLWGYYVRSDFGKIIDLLLSKDRVRRTVTLAGLLLCLSASVLGLFPETLRYQNTTVNILAHYVGYGFGFIVPAMVSILVVERRKT